VGQSNPEKHRFWPENAHFALDRYFGLGYSEFTCGLCAEAWRPQICLKGHSSMSHDAKQFETSTAGAAGLRLRFVGLPE